MTKEGYQEFIEFTQHLYANRDAYSRGKIIEDIRDKVIELEQSSLFTVVQAEPEKVTHGDNCKYAETCCKDCYNEYLEWRKE